MPPNANSAASPSRSTRDDVSPRWLLAVENPKPLKAYFLQGHGRTRRCPIRRDRLPEIRHGAGRNYIATAPLSTVGDNAVPDDCNLLIIAGPALEFQEPELQRLTNTRARRTAVHAVHYFSIKASDRLETDFAKVGRQCHCRLVPIPNGNDHGQDVYTFNFSSHPPSIR